jgi:hypothetical protein
VDGIPAIVVFALRELRVVLRGGVRSEYNLATELLFARESPRGQAFTNL